MMQTAIATENEEYDQYKSANWNQLVIHDLPYVRVDRVIDASTNPPKILSQEVFKGYEARLTKARSEDVIIQQKFKKLLGMRHKKLVEIMYLDILCKRYSHALKAYEKLEERKKQLSLEKKQNTQARAVSVANHNMAMINANNNFINSNQQQNQQPLQHSQQALIMAPHTPAHIEEEENWGDEDDDIVMD